MSDYYHSHSTAHFFHPFEEPHKLHVQGAPMQIATSCSSRRRKGVNCKHLWLLIWNRKLLFWMHWMMQNDAYLATCEHVRKDTSSGAEEEHIAFECWWGWQSVVSHVLLLLHKITSRHSSCSINLADKSRIRVGRFLSRNHRRWCITNSTLYVTGRKLNAFAEAERRWRRSGSRCVLKTTKRDSVQWNALPKASPAQMES